MICILLMGVPCSIWRTAIITLLQQDLNYLVQEVKMTCKFVSFIMRPWSNTCLDVIPLSWRNMQSKPSIRLLSFVKLCHNILVMLWLNILVTLLQNPTNYVFIIVRLKVYNAEQTVRPKLTTEQPNMLIDLRWPTPQKLSHA